MELRVIERSLESISDPTFSRHRNCAQKWLEGLGIP